jgi:3-hydroxy-D-aspartate aldolase
MTPVVRSHGPPPPETAITEPTRPPRLGERIEFFPPHCDPTFNLYDRVYAVRGGKMEQVWPIGAGGRSD